MPSYTQYLRQMAVLDNEWNEEDHPRDEDGKFTDGAGTSHAAKHDNPAGMTLEEWLSKPRTFLRGMRKMDLTEYRVSKGYPVPGDNIVDKQRLPGGISKQDMRNLQRAAEQNIELYEQSLREYNELAAKNELPEIESIINYHGPDDPEGIVSAARMAWKRANKNNSGTPKIPLHVVVKPVADIKAYRKETLKWYKDNLQGKTVQHPELGDILLSNRGGHHILQKSGPEKLALTRILPEMIKSGQSEGWQPLNKTRNDGWVEFAFIYNNVVINGKEKRVGVYIAKDQNGKIFYDIVLPKEKGLVSNPQSIKGQNKAFTTDSIDDEDWIVNIFIEDAK